MTGDKPGFGVYVHWPFCRSKCPYCDFNSHVRHSIDEDRWERALLAEIDWIASHTAPETAHTVFFGGGTPSLMAPRTVAAVIDRIAARFNLAPDAEITLEANPTSVEAEKFRSYRAAGVNRLSMGVQALDDAALARLGRTHSVAEALAAFDIARSSFDRLSFDLIYARPGQTLADWQMELDRALALAVNHLSLYQLTIEADTPYAALHARGKLVIPDDDMAADLYALTQDRCNGAGMAAYEVSNHARPGAACRHNLLYWRYGRYAGIGPGAHGRVIREGNLTATATHRHPETWLSAVERDGHGIAESLAIPPEDAAREALLMGLRLNEGVALDRVAAVIPAGRIETLARLGHVVQAGNRLQTTVQGRLVLNAVIAALVD